jgi:hypothetical protein
MGVFHNAITSIKVESAWPPVNTNAIALSAVSLGLEELTFALLRVLLSRRNADDPVNPRP